jgi:hypothetical protein
LQIQNWIGSSRGVAAGWGGKLIQQAFKPFQSDVDISAVLY